MTRITQEQRERTALVGALTDLLTAAADARVRQTKDDVEATAYLADAILRRHFGKTDPEPSPVARIMDALGIDEDEAVRRICEEERRR